MKEKLVCPLCRSSYVDTKELYTPHQLPQQLQHQLSLALPNNLSYGSTIVTINENNSVDVFELRKKRVGAICLIGTCIVFYFLVHSYINYLRN